MEEKDSVASETTTETNRQDAETCHICYRQIVIQATSQVNNAWVSDNGAYLCSLCLMTVAELKRPCGKESD